MAEADDLQTILSQITTRITQVTASNNPDYSIAGRTISKGAYLSQLIAARKEIKAALQAAGDEGDAWEVRGVGIT